MLDQAAAAALFAIVVSSTSGANSLARQKPWHVEDRGDAYLVVGSPYTVDGFVRFVKTHVFFAKSDAEVLGIGNDGRQILTAGQDAEWRRTMTPQQYNAIFAESFDWERDGVRDAIHALYGGVVNTPADAVAYAKVLLAGTPRGMVLAQGLLTAVERDKVWHIARAPGTVDVLSFSQTTGKLLSALP